MRVTVIRTTGQREEHEVEGGTLVFDRLYPLAGCDTFDIVNLKDGRVMLVDDAGYETEFIDHGMQPGNPDDPNPLKQKPWRYMENRCTQARKPVNEAATKLYHAVCAPGTTHQIVGDVIVANDADFGEDEG